VSWDAVSGADSYKLYALSSDDNPGLYYPWAVEITSTSYIHDNNTLEEGTTWYFKVTAVNSNGESAESEYASATKVGHNSISYIVYNEGEGDGTPPETQYVVVGVTITLPGVGEMIAPTGKTFAGWLGRLDSSLDTTWTCQSGESYTVSDVDYVSFTAQWQFPVPSTPENVKAEALSSSSIRVSWDAVTGADSYKVYYGNSPDDSFTNSIGGGTGTSYTDASCAPETTRYYKVSAVNGTGESEKSSATSATTPELSVPSAPSNVTATAQSSSNIRITWNTVSGATSYKVYYEIGSSSTKNLAGTVTSGTSYTHTGLQSSTTYYYYITAINSAGESGYSAYGSAATSSSGGGTTVPSAPTNISATAQSSSSISVSWNSVSGATSYKVYYEIGSSSTKNLAGTVTGTSYTHTELEANTTYWYYIKAVNSAGESGYSTGSSAKTSSSSGGGTTTILQPDTFTVSKTTNGVIALLIYPTSQKSTVNTYTYILYEDGQAVFAYTNAPNEQSDDFGTIGMTTTEGSTYGIALVDPTMLFVPGTYKIKVEVRKSGLTSYFTPERTVTIN
jgi:fibronectin type 3 domain-containing protein